MVDEASRVRDVRLLATLRGLAFLGDAVALVALYLRLAPLGHAWAVAGLSVAGTLPLVLLAPLAGQVVDRYPAKKLLSTLALAEAVFCVALGTWHGVGATLALMLALSTLVAFSLPGYSALLPHLAGAENVARSQSLLQAVQGSASVLGPFLGGVLVGWTGQRWPLYLDAGCYVAVALGTSALRHDRRPSVATTLDEVEHEGALAGVVLIWRDAVVRPTVVTVLFFLLALGMTNVAEVFFATRVLHASATLYGLIGASFGLGSVLGALAARRLAQAVTTLVRTVLLCIVLVGLAIALVGLVTVIGAVYPLMAVAGVGAGVANVAALTLFTLRTPEPVRGRVFAAIGGIFTASQLGATTLGGLVLTVFSPRTVFQVGGGVATICALVMGPLALRASVRAATLEAAQGD